MTERKILIADNDVETVRALKRGLEPEFKVIAARDGSKALELSITEFPDLIMVYRHCPLIPAKQFLRILRTNPRTESIPLIILADEAVATSTLPGYLEGILVKPLNLDEVRAHLSSVFTRADAAREVGQESGAVQGSLTQISMVDLVQVFAMNRRSGCIRLSGGPDGETAEVFVADGRIEDAKIGFARGEKALYRILGWSAGSFSFVPGGKSATATIGAATDSLLMEGMRQGDELARIREAVPSADAEIKRLVPPDGVPEGLHPVTAEILDLLQYYSKVGDLVDRAKATDLEVYLALQSLVSNEIIRVTEVEAEAGVEPLLTQDEIFDLLGRLRQAGMSPTFLHRPKITLVAERETLREFSSGLARIPEFEANNLEDVVSNRFGSLGSLQLSTGFTPELVAVAPDERLLPLVFSMSAGCIAAVCLGEIAEAGVPVLRMLERERRVAVLTTSPRPLKGIERVRRVAVDTAEESAAREVLKKALTDINAAELRDVAI